MTVMKHNMHCKWALHDNKSQRPVIACGSASCVEMVAHRHVENDVVNTERCNLSGVALRSRLVVWAVGLLRVPATSWRQCSAMELRPTTERHAWPVFNNLTYNPKPLFIVKDSRKVVAIMRSWQHT